MTPTDYSLVFADAATVLKPVVSRVVTSHCWLKHGEKITHIRRALTPERLTRHLNGGPYVGATAIEPGGSTTRIAVLDLDSHHGETSWPRMQAAALDVMRALEARGMRPIPFRSSGGAGVHLYVLWDAPQDAHSARCALRAALADAGYVDGAAGVAARQIEVFPKQPHVPVDGYGSMFVLPLAGASVPLDAFDLDDAAVGSLVWPTSAPVPLSEPEAPRASPVNEIPVELATLRAALDAIPNTGKHELDYDTWRNVIFGIHHATKGSDVGLVLAHAFSARASKYDAVFLGDRVWPYVGRSNDATPITARSILRLAHEHGWEEPLDDDFEALTPEPRVNSFQLALVRAEEPIKPDLVKGVVPDADFGIIYGPSGAGKSFVAIDLGFHLALGRAWRGRKVRQRNVYYIAAEGALGVRRRAKAYALYHEIDPHTPFYTRERPVNLYAKNGWVRAAEDINEHAAGQPGVIIIDTLARSMPGAEENSAKDMGLVVENCAALRRATGCTVVVVAHAGKEVDKGVRGSTALRAAADFELSVTRQPDTPYRCLKLTKSKDDVDGVEFPFRLTSVDVGVDEDGETVCSAVVVESETAPIEITERPQSKDAARALDAYMELSEFALDGWIDIEKVIDRVLEQYPNSQKNARVNVRRWISGANKLAIFDVFDGKVRYSATQDYSE